MAPRTFPFKMQVGVRNREQEREAASRKEGGERGCHGPQNRRDLTKSDVHEDGNPKEVPEWELGHKE